MMCRQAGQTCIVNCPPGLSPKGAVFPLYQTSDMRRGSPSSSKRRAKTAVCGAPRNSTQTQVDQPFPGGNPRNFALFWSSRTCMEWAGEYPWAVFTRWHDVIAQTTPTLARFELTRTYVHQSRETRCQVNASKESGAPSPRHMLEARLIEMIDPTGRGDECEASWRRATPKTGPASSNPQFPGAS
jgi:hypothetical protein